MSDNKITVKKDNFGDLLNILKTLGEKQILVGVIEDKTARREGEETNASILYKNTVGSPLERIPPRPLLEPAIEANKEKIGKQFRKVISNALLGKAENLEKDLAHIGSTGEMVVKKWFDDPQNNWAPNSPYTIRMKGSDSPMIDTGQLRQSIHYAVRNKQND